MDDLDEKLLALLIADSSTPVIRLARKLGIARSTAQARLERLEAAGTIAGYTIRVGDAVRRSKIRATVLVSVEPRAAPAVLQRLRPMPEVEVCRTTSGRVDLVLTVAADDPARLDSVLDRVGAIPGVTNTESLIHLTTKWDRQS